MCHITNNKVQNISPSCPFHLKYHEWEVSELTTPFGSSTCSSMYVEVILLVRLFDVNIRSIPLLAFNGCLFSVCSSIVGFLGVVVSRYIPNLALESQEEFFDAPEYYLKEENGDQLKEIDIEDIFFDSIDQLPTEIDEYILDDDSIPIPAFSPKNNEMIFNLLANGHAA